MRNMTTRPHHSVAALAAFCAMAASAQELAILGGGTWTDEPHERTHGWMVEYLHPLDGPWAASFAYQNEGHVPGHHRDGHAVQLWLRTPPARGWSLAAGFGPYYSFDTALAESPGEHQDAHGWGAITTVAIGWRDGASLWSWQVRVNHVETRNGPDSTMLLVGVGRHLEQDATFGVRAAGRREELSLATGQTIVNSFESQGARARAIEYRHDFGGVLRGS